MANILVTGPTVEPVTLAELKTHCRVDITDDDDYLTALGIAAREHTEMYCRRAWIYQTWRLTLDRWPLYYLPVSHSWRYGWNRWNRADYGQVEAGLIHERIPQELMLPTGPLSSITSIQYIDTAGATQTLDASSYQVDTQSLWGRIAPAYSTYWPMTRPVTNAVQITYVAGYSADAASVPSRVKHAIKLLVGNWYSLRESVINSRYATKTPYAVDALLGGLRVISVGT